MNLNLTCLCKGKNLTTKNVISHGSVFQPGGHRSLHISCPECSLHIYFSKVRKSDDSHLENYTNRLLDMRHSYKESLLKEVESNEGKYGKHDKL